MPLPRNGSAACHCTWPGTEPWPSSKMSQEEMSLAGCNSRRAWQTLRDLENCTDLFGVWRDALSFTPSMLPAMDHCAWMPICLMLSDFLCSQGNLKLAPARMNVSKIGSVENRTKMDLLWTWYERVVDQQACYSKRTAEALPRLDPVESANFSGISMGFNCQ